MAETILINEQHGNIIKRVSTSYSLLEQDIMKLKKQNILNELEVLKLTGKVVTFENQKIIALKVITAFKNRQIINIMVVSKTQSGKTGSMCATIKQYLEESSNLIPIENIYIITALSSCEWKEQTKERMPESIQNRVFHRSELSNTFIDEIKNRTNLLIIMDEIQIAAKKNQTIYKTFEKAGLLDIETLYKKDIKILEYSATPDGTIHDLMEWKQASTKILAEPGDGYVSAYNLLQTGRVKQYKNLCGYCIETYLSSLDKDDKFCSSLKTDRTIISNYIKQIIKDDIKDDIMFNKELFTDFIKTNNLEKYDTIIDINTMEIIYDDIKEIFENIEEVKSDIKKYTNHLYHIIRTKNGPAQDLTIQNFKEIFNSDDYDFIKYDRTSKIKNINKTLISQPKTHTFIFIKEMLRCAKTLTKDYIGILYDRYSIDPDDSTILQGLIGRDTGYNNNGISICYTNKDSIERYEKLWEGEFEDKTIRWKSKTTKNTRDGCISRKNTFNESESYKILKDSDDSIDNSHTKETVTKKFKTQEEVKKYYNKELKTTYLNSKGPNKRKPNKDGYYEATIKTKTKVWSCDELDKKPYIGAANNNYWFYPCYRDINDKSTLEWWLIH